MPDSGASHRYVCGPFCSLICSVVPPSLLSSLIVSLGHLADTGLRAPGFLWTRHFPKITWAKHFHSQAGWGHAEAAVLMGKRWISAGWRHPCRSTGLRANTFIILMLRWREVMMTSPIHWRIGFYILQKCVTLTFYSELMYVRKGNPGCVYWLAWRLNIFKCLFVQLQARFPDLKEEGGMVQCKK